MRHSLSILNLIQQYDTFLESIRHVADLGCGSGEDINWWATLENNNDPPEPYNFNCFAVDNNADRLAQVPNLKNIHKIHDIYDRPFLFPVSIDLIWAHDSLPYSINPLETLRLWNSYMTVNGMLLLSVPQHTGIEYDRHYSRGYSGCYFHYNPINLIYMLAVNGFDCRDAYLLKKFQDPWIQTWQFIRPISHPWIP
jgi:SAM-dependent methyltransferase